jgi:hypothetical protein
VATVRARLAGTKQEHTMKPYHDVDEYISRCPACGDPIDYCQGHGASGDPTGFAILAGHDDGDHSGCHPQGCEDAAVRYDGRDGSLEVSQPEEDAMIAQQDEIIDELELRVLDGNR